MNMDGIPHVTDVWSRKSYECRCPVCNAAIQLSQFKYHSKIRLTGSLIQCRVCATRFFAIKPEKD